KSSFITNVYQVQTYETLQFTQFDSQKKRLNKRKSTALNKYKEDNVVYPNELNDTHYTGKGINVAVIDTGIDYTHPDLQPNYIKGKDLVDLDDDPMETTADEGLPTN